MDFHAALHECEAAPYARLMGGTPVRVDTEHQKSGSVVVARTKPAPSEAMQRRLERRTAAGKASDSTSDAESAQSTHRPSCALRGYCILEQSPIRCTMIDPASGTAESGNRDRGFGSKLEVVGL